MIAEIERRKRINVALWAYAYEIMDDPLVSDECFDRVCREINPAVSTENPVMDGFFRNEFSPDTGMWIYKHPNCMGLARIYSRLTGKPARAIAYSNESPLVPSQVSRVGFKTQTEMKLYLASLGLRVIPDFQVIGGRPCSVEYDTEFARFTDTRTGECRSVAYRDIFERAV